MSRIILAFLSMFALFALGALGASSAPAACSGGTQSVVCLGNEEIHSEGGSGTVGLALFASTIGGAEFKLHCKDAEGRGTLELLGASKEEVEFLGCRATAPLNCSVNESITAKFTAQLSSGIMPATGLIKGSGSGEELAKITITGASCSVAGSYTVSGLQTVEIPSGETSLSEHEIVAKKSGSKLKLGTEIGSFSTTAKVKLTSGSAFLIMLGS
jgi:hypothetical protein